MLANRQALDFPLVKQAASRLTAVLLGATLSSLLATSCSTVDRVLALDFFDLPETRVANLEALHNSTGGHRYTARMVGDMGYALGRQNWTIAGLQIGQRRSGAARSKEETIENPSELCLELLGELLDFDSSDNPRLACVQVAWCARLAVEDPSVLTRERAVLGMGPLGAQVGFDRLLRLEPETPRAGPEEVAGLLSRLLGSVRAQREGTILLSGEGARSFEDAIGEVRDTTYDVDGARRVLVAVGALLQGVDEESVEHARLVDLAAELQRRTIGLTLGLTRSDESPFVRAATARAATAAGGELLLARFMHTLTVERDPIAVRLFLELLAERGLPGRPAEITEEEFPALREEWLGAVVGHALDDPESMVRVKAMQALSAAVDDGPNTLREEDWERWWFARIDRLRAEHGLGPLPAAVGDGEDEGR